MWWTSYGSAAGTGLQQKKYMQQHNCAIYPVNRYPQIESGNIPGIHSPSTETFYIVL